MIEDEQPSAVCIAALPPGGQRHARYLCKRLRKRFGQLRIIVGRWGDFAAASGRQKSIKKAGASQVQTTLLETRNDIKAWLPALSRQAEDTDQGNKNGKSTTATNGTVIAKVS